jgi:CRISPR-associated endonuclease Csn1
MGRRLGLSLGTGSIGWALLETNEDRPADILRAGVRIFSDGRDPHTGDALAVNRRRARGARVRRDRLIRRKSDLRKSLATLGLFPADKSEQEKLKSLNPYELRVRAVTGILTPHELGRVLIHLSQRRGFQSNRKGSRKEDEEEKKDRIALDHALRESGLTLGQYLYQRLKEGKGVRARAGEGLMTLREHYKHEFAQIRQTQKPHHSLGEEDWDRIAGILFFQRGLRPQQRGYCQIYFRDKAEHAWRAMPSFQRFRIEQTLANLRIIGPDRSKYHLSADQRAQLREKMLAQKTIGFGKIRTLLGLAESCSFNLETARRRDLKGDATGALMMRHDYFGGAWRDLDLRQQDEIVGRVLEEADPQTLKTIARTEWGLSEDQAQALADLNHSQLESGTAGLSTRALHELIPLVSGKGMSVTQAVAKIRSGLGLTALAERAPAPARGNLLNSAPPPREAGRIFRIAPSREGAGGARPSGPALEYYGTVMPDLVVPQPRAAVEEERVYGRINDPPVHIALNQLRKLVNEIIAEHGPPDEIVAELARDLKLLPNARKNLARKRNSDRHLSAEAAEFIKGQGVAVNDENILRYKLWKELNAEDINDRNSPYSGRNISIGQLFGDQVAVGHILPVSRTLDDSYNNKTLCFVDEKRAKGNFSPHEACLNAAWPFDYDEIVSRASCLPRRKRFRFEADAMERWEYRDSVFIARQLTERQYLSNAVRRYLESLYQDGGKIHGRIVAGQLTAKIRGQWRLNSILSGDGNNEESRNDHRRHAIDAVVIGCTDQGLLEGAAAMAAQSQELEFAVPFGRGEEFRGRVKDRVDAVIVSHRPDHGYQGALHEETNYGIIEHPNEYEAANNYNAVYRKPFVSLFAGLEAEKAGAKAAEIRDGRLRRDLMNLLEGASAKEEVAGIIEAFAREEQIRHIRLLKKESTIIPIVHPASTKRFRKFVAPKTINHVGFWQMPCGEIRAVGRSVFEVNQAKGDMNRLKPHPAARLKMTLYKKDTVRVVKSGRTMTCTVVSLSPAGKSFKLRPHNLGESEEFRISFSQVRNYQVRKLSITASGQVHDPGPIFQGSACLP